MPSAQPRWRRFERPELEVRWAAINTFDPADRLTLLREMATEVVAGGPTATPHDKVVAGLLSLRDAAEVLGCSPSRHEYRQMRVDFPGLDLVRTRP
jgi:hypothetical protein